MTIIVDYGVGNLFSLKSSFSAIGEKAEVSSDAATISAADRIVLPGVGAFSDAAAKLEKSGLKEVVIGSAKSGAPLLGICLGMQLLFDKSYEYGEYEGLGLIKGEVVAIPEKTGLKIPHIGWNALDIVNDHPLLNGINSGDYFYFVHSYYAKTEKRFTLAITEYGAMLTAAVADKNVMGCQFHPEKSGETGLKILKAFCEIKKGDL